MIEQTHALAVKQRDMLRLAAYQAELRRRPRLRFLFLEMTDRCNLRCAHCGSGCGPEGGVFLPFAVMERVLRSTAARFRPEGIMICLTGGEPLLHPDVVRVIALSRGLGFACGITTNATLIDRNTARRMAAAGLDTVAVSVDGAHEAHDAFRRAPGALSRALEGVRELRAAGLDPQAVTVVHAGNLARLEALDDFLRREGFTSWRLTNVDPIGRAAARPDLLLDGPGLRRLLDFIRDRRFRPGRDMEVTYGCAHFLGPADERMTRDFYFQCGAGVLVGSVRANGDIGACLDIPPRPELIQGNAHHDDFVQVWTTRFQVFRQDRAADSPVCGQCVHRRVCMGDATHTWDFETKTPRYCVFQKLMEVENDE